ncbi:hypothetical protein J6590_027773 [Homalodisca vitripennis]|nr:hypothetical protein J6590_027773 [Homalodisca vitripennis]
MAVGRDDHPYKTRGKDSTHAFEQLLSQDGINGTTQEFRINNSHVELTADVISMLDYTRIQDERQMNDSHVELTTGVISMLDYTRIQDERQSCGINNWCN